MAHSGMSEVVMADVLDAQAPDSIAQLEAVGWSILAFSAISGWNERPSAATSGIRLIRNDLRRIQNHPPFRPPERAVGATIAEL